MKTAALPQYLRAFLVTKGLFYTQNAFFKLFINIYFWRITENIPTLVLYNVVFYFAHLLAYVPSGKTAKEYSRFIPLRIGMVLQFCFLASIVYLQDSVIDWMVPVALLGGFASGLYWSSDNILKFDLTNPENRLRFTSIHTILKELSKGLVPFLVGLFLTVDGDIESYTKVFSIAAVLTVATFISSFWISKSKQFTGVSDFRFLPIARDLLKNPNVWRAGMSNFFVEVAFALPILLGLMLFFATGNELSIGSYQAITVALGILAYAYIGKRFTKKHYRSLLVYGGALNFAVVFILFINQSYTAVLLYGILSTLFAVADAPRHPIAMDVLNMTCSTKEECIDKRVEYITILEIFGAAGKMVGFCILLLLHQSLSVVVIGTAAALLAGAQFASNIIISRVEEQEYVKVDELN